MRYDRSSDRDPSGQGFGRRLQPHLRTRIGVCSRSFCEEEKIGIEKSRSRSDKGDLEQDPTDHQEESC